MCDTIEVDIEHNRAVPLRHQLYRLNLAELQSMAHDLALGGTIARGTKSELAARLASKILVSREREHEDEDPTVGPRDDAETPPVGA
eukprot:269031-Prymnesium_polylepis.2